MVKVLSTRHEVLRRLLLKIVKDLQSSCSLAVLKAAAANITCDCSTMSLELISGIVHQDLVKESCCSVSHFRDCTNLKPTRQPHTACHQPLVDASHHASSDLHLHDRA